MCLCECVFVASARKSLRWENKSSSVASLSLSLTFSSLWLEPDAECFLPLSSTLTHLYCLMLPLHATLCVWVSAVTTATKIRISSGTSSSSSLPSLWVLCSLSPSLSSQFSTVQVSCLSYHLSSLFSGLFRLLSLLTPSSLSILARLSSFHPHPSLSLCIHSLFLSLFSPSPLQPSTCIIVPLGKRVQYPYSSFVALPILKTLYFSTWLSLWECIHFSVSFLRLSVSHSFHSPSLSFMLFCLKLFHLPPKHLVRIFSHTWHHRRPFVHILSSLIN